MTFSLLTKEELASDPPPVNWLVKFLVAQGSLTLLAGEGGLGKSSITLALATAVRNGLLSYAGFEIARFMPIAYIDGENSRDEIHRRANSFGIYELIYQFDGDMLESFGGLEDVAAQVRGGMLVLDSFRSLFPTVEEKDDKQVLPALKGVQDVARAYDVGIIMLHHTSKAGVYRGSTEFQNRPDILCTLRRDVRMGHRYLDWNKVRIGMEPERQYVRLVSEGVGMSWEEASAPLAARSAQLLDEIISPKSINGGL